MEKHKPQPMDREAFHTVVIDSKKTCLVCFMAQWSEPSRQMDQPVIDITHKWYGLVPVYLIDPDEEPFIMSEYSINAVPTLVMFRDGQAVDRIVGIRTPGQIDKFVRDIYER